MVHSLRAPRVYYCFVGFLCFFATLCISHGKSLYPGQNSQLVNGNISVNETVHGQSKGKPGTRVTFPIAFSTYLSRIYVFDLNQTIIFDHVLLNDGDGYDRGTGVFTAPISGVYSFEYMIAQLYPGTSTCGLYVDEEPVSFATADAYKTNNYVQSGNSVIKSIIGGQTVRLQYLRGDGWIVSTPGQGYSTFSGYLLYVA